MDNSAITREPPLRLAITILPETIKVKMITGGEVMVNSTTEAEVARKVATLGTAEESIRAPKTWVRVVSN